MIAEEPPRTILPACTVLDWVAVFFVSFVTSAIGFVIGGAIGGQGTLSETCGGLIGLWVAIVPGALLLSRWRGTGSLATDYGLRVDLRRDWVGVPAGIASQLLLLPVIYGLLQLLMDRDLTDDLQAPAKELTDQADGGPAFVLLAVLLIVGAPIVEEIFYRGMLFVALRPRFSPPVTVVVCGVVFGAAHLQLLLLPGLAAFGIVLGWLRARSDRLGAGILAHATFNAITVAALAST